MAVYIFPGQGSQSVGMGKETFAIFPEEVALANTILKFDIEDLCLNNPENKLHNTQFSQPAIYLLSCLEYLKQIQLKKVPDFVLGHSLGEYAAYFAAGIFDLTTGLKLVKARGELMAKQSGGAMLAVLGIDKTSIQAILLENDLLMIDFANYNTDNQIVLSGLMTDIERLSQILDSHKIRHVKLNVSGAFHSRYMEKARLDFAQVLLQYDWNEIQIPVVSSCSAQIVEHSYIYELLLFQLVKPVRWVDSISFLLKQGETDFVELGPGQVLTKLNQNIIQARKDKELC